MSMVVKENGGADIPVLEEGVYIGVCSNIVDLGIQMNEKFGKESRKMMLIWTIADEKIELKDEVYDRTMHKQYGFSLHAKANLRKDLEAWRGKAFTDEELKGFDMKNLLNVPCQMQIIVKEKEGRKFNEIAGIMALSKGMKVEKLKEDKLFIFDMEDKKTFSKFKEVSKWIQERIKTSLNYVESGLKKYIEENISKEEAEASAEYITVEDTDELPF